MNYLNEMNTTLFMLVFFGGCFLIALGLTLIIGFIIDWRDARRWSVIYSDGKVSEKMPKRIAKDYAKIFGGTLIKRHKKYEKEGRS